MFRLAWKSLLGRKLRLVMSAFSIVLGVAFVVGSLMFTNLLSGSFDSLLRGAVADINPVGLSENAKIAFSSTETGWGSRYAADQGQWYLAGI